MGNALQIFNNNEFGKVRVAMMNGEPWFVGKDVAIALGYSNTRDALSRHVDTEDKTSVVIPDGGSNYKSKATLINESGVYALIFGSKLPSAKRFKHWVTKSVLPTIRKTGMYKVDSYIIDDPVERAKRWIEEQEAHRKQIAELKHKADFADQVVASADSIDIASFAKIIHDNLHITFGRNNMYNWLREHCFLIPRGEGKNLPYQRYINNGYFEVQEKTYFVGSILKTARQTYITGRGQVALFKRIQKECNNR